MDYDQLLVEAVIRDDLEGVNEAIANGANSDSDVKRYRLLTTAFQIGSEESIILALINTPNFDFNLDYFGKTVNNRIVSKYAVEFTGGNILHWAAFFDYIEVAKVAIENGVYINKKDNNLGATPLVIAIAKHHGEMINLLLDHHAIVTMNTIDYAILSDNREVFEQILTLLPKRLINDELYDLIKTSIEHNMTWSLDIINKYYTDSVKVIIIDDQYIDLIIGSLLHRAVIYDSVDAIDWLVGHGMNVNTVDERGCTALFLLTSCWDSDKFGIYNELANRLLVHGIDLFIKDNNGLTVIEKAKQEESKNNSKYKLSRIIESFMNEMEIKEPDQDE